MFGIGPSEKLKMNVYSSEQLATMFPIATDVLIELKAGDEFISKDFVSCMLLNMRWIQVGQTCLKSSFSPSFSIWKITSNGKPVKSALVSSSTKISCSTPPSTSLQSNSASCAGLESEMSTIEEIINLSINCQDFSTFQITPPRGILLYGPPGTGKTLLVKTIAKKLNLHLVVIDNSIIHGKYFGDAERMVYLLPCFLFMNIGVRSETVLWRQSEIVLLLCLSMRLILSAQREMYSVMFS